MAPPFRPAAGRPRRPSSSNGRAEWRRAGALREGRARGAGPCGRDPQPAPAEAGVSSMKTSRVGSRSSWPLNQAVPPGQDVLALLLGSVGGPFHGDLVPLEDAPEPTVSYVDAACSASAARNSWTVMSRCASKSIRLTRHAPRRVAIAGRLVSASDARHPSTGPAPANG